MILLLRTNEAIMKDYSHAPNKLKVGWRGVVSCVLYCIVCTYLGRYVQSARRPGGMKSSTETIQSSNVHPRFQRQTADMFGAFRPTSSLSIGVLWYLHSHPLYHCQPNLLSDRKIPWRLSRPQKARQRKRLRAVDAVVATIDAALGKQNTTAKVLERWKAEMPREDQMKPKDKYTFFDRKEKGYRKGVHSESICSFGFTSFYFLEKHLSFFCCASVNGGEQT